MGRRLQEGGGSWRKEDDGIGRKLSEGLLQVGCRWDDVTVVWGRGLESSQGNEGRERMSGAVLRVPGGAMGSSRARWRTGESPCSGEGVGNNSRQFPTNIWPLRNLSSVVG